MATTTSRNGKRAINRAQQLYDELRAQGEYSVQGFEEIAFRELKKFKKHSYEAFVKYIVEKVDQRATKERPSDQPSLFPEFDLDGVYRLGKGRRIDKRLAQLHHLDEVLIHDARNNIAVMQASLRKQQEIAKLRPYYTAHGTTKEQAVASYRAEYPTPHDN